MNIQDILDSGPSEDNWEALCDWLDAQPDVEHMTKAVDTVYDKVSRWPLDLRVGRESWFKSERDPRTAVIGTARAESAQWLDKNLDDMDDRQVSQLIARAELALKRDAIKESALVDVRHRCALQFEKLIAEADELEAEAVIALDDAQPGIAKECLAARADVMARAESLKTVYTDYRHSLDDFRLIIKKVKTLLASAKKRRDKSRGFGGPSGGSASMFGGTDRFAFGNSVAKTVRAAGEDRLTVETFTFDDRIPADPEEAFVILLSR